MLLPPGLSGLLVPSPGWDGSEPLFLEQAIKVKHAKRKHTMGKIRAVVFIMMDLRIGIKIHTSNGVLLFFLSSATLYFTILVTRPAGIGSSSGNWTAPFDPL